jgi:hypothetical protein
MYPQRQREFPDIKPSHSFEAVTSEGIGSKAAGWKDINPFIQRVVQEAATGYNTWPLIVRYS